MRHFRQQFGAVSDDGPLAEAVHRCVIAFNDFDDFDDASMPQHRVRMQLILTTPALQARSCATRPGAPSSANTSAGDSDSRPMRPPPAATSTSP